MPKVKARKNESFDQTLKRFIREVNQAGVIKETRLREFHMKDSERRRQLREEKERRIRADQRRRRR